MVEFGEKLKRVREEKRMTQQTLSEHLYVTRQAVSRWECLTIDPQRYTVTLAEEEIDLYPKEFDVLYLLMQYPGWVLSPEQVYETVWQGIWLDVSMWSIT